MKPAIEWAPPSAEELLARGVGVKPAPKPVKPVKPVTPVKPVKPVKPKE